MFWQSLLPRSSISRQREASNTSMIFQVCIMYRLYTLFEKSAQLSAGFRSLHCTFLQARADPKVIETLTQRHVSNIFDMYRHDSTKEVHPYFFSVEHFRQGSTKESPEWQETFPLSVIFFHLHCFAAYNFSKKHRKAVHYASVFLFGLSERFFRGGLSQPFLSASASSIKHPQARSSIPLSLSCALLTHARDPASDRPGIWCRRQGALWPMPCFLHRRRPIPFLCPARSQGTL